jgi:hypothetical protein
MRNPLQAMLEGQFSKVSENIQKALEELEATEVEGSAGGGAVKVVATGSGQVLSVTIAPEVVSPEDIELLQDLICAAMRDVMAKSIALRQQKLSEATPLAALGIDLPNMF